jgi:hypothetical protein
MPQQAPPTLADQIRAAQDAKNAAALEQATRATRRRDQARAAATPEFVAAADLVGVRVDEIQTVKRERSGDIVITNTRGTTYRWCATPDGAGVTGLTIVNPRHPMAIPTYTERASRAKRSKNTPAVKASTPALPRRSDPASIVRLGELGEFSAVVDARAALDAAKQDVAKLRSEVARLTTPKLRQRLVHAGDAAAIAVHDERVRLAPIELAVAERVQRETQAALNELHAVRRRIVDLELDRRWVATAVGRRDGSITPEQADEIAYAVYAERHQLAGGGPFVDGGDAARRHASAAIAAETRGADDLAGIEREIADALAVLAGDVPGEAS